MNKYIPVDMVRLDNFLLDVPKVSFYSIAQQRLVSIKYCWKKIDIWAAESNDKLMSESDILLSGLFNGIKFC